MTFPPAQPGPAADLGIIAPWMASQRWYANKGVLPRLEEIGAWQLAGAGSTARIVTHLLLDHAAGRPALYQVPLTYRGDPLPHVRPLGRVADTWVYDAPQDAAYADALLHMMSESAEYTGRGTWALGAPAEGGVRSAPTDSINSRVLSGEQSNTSLVIESPDVAGVPVILKVFRTIHDGENPDVELQGVLSAAGSPWVPRGVGHVISTWPDTGQPTGRARGHLVAAQEFLPGAQDGWRIAIEAAAAGVDFADRAHELGVATAGVHATLAARLPTQPAEARDIDETLGQMTRRLTMALDEVPQLAPHERSLRAVLERAREARWPVQQRIHGDLHLGQVLGVPHRGWVLVDFEGEPLRPMRERRRRDSPLRDVAGMLRSFDYVAGSLRMSSGRDAEGWAARARRAFIAGYGEAVTLDLSAEQALLDAFEADKALYEAVYEARNRPDWLPIPVAAIEQLATRGAY